MPSLLNRILPVLMLLLTAVPCFAQSVNEASSATSKTALILSNILEIKDPVEKFERYEATFSLNRTYSGAQPFDPEVIDISAVFTAPSGQQVAIPAFYNQDYTVSNPSYEAYTAKGSPHWKVRFVPTVEGIYTWRIKAREVGGETASGEISFTANPSSRKGFIRRAAENPLLLKHDDGTWYFPIGHNIAFGDGNPDNLNGTYYYSQLLSNLGKASGNWTRIWMTDFERSSLEWSSGHFSGFYNGIGVYSLKSAFRVEKILELAELNGVAAQLVLNDHGQFSSWVNERWADNPYNLTKGGMVPSGNPGQFFSMPEAMKYHQRRLRYLIARYSGYSSLLCWELFNEVQFSGSSQSNWFNSLDFRRNVIAWHQTMARWIKKNDPFQHLVTTSSHDSNFYEIWKIPEIDLAQLHDYSSPSANRDILLHDSLLQIQGISGKPAIAGEFGLGWDGASECNFNPTAFNGSEADKNHLLQGTHLHNSIWAGAMTNSAACLWWWGCYLEPDAGESRTSPGFPLYNHHYPHLRTFFGEEPLLALNLASSNLVSPASTIAFGLTNTHTAFVWVRDAKNTYGSGVAPGNLPPARLMSDVLVRIPELSDGSYEINFYDPWTGSWVGEALGVSHGGEGLTLLLPDFSRDLAVKVSKSTPSDSSWIFY